MNPLTREWIEKAEGDYHAAGLLFRARKHPNYDAVCFHAQQCAEKYMKSVLHEAGKPFDRTHVLGVLLDDLISLIPMWEALRPAAETLVDYAVGFRYPGRSADREMAKSALGACELIRGALRQYLDLRPTARKRPRRRRDGRRRG
jgi:HEPN domain-containing protein